MADIIIRDGSTGEVKIFSPTSEGYAAAKAATDAITQKGHTVVSSDLGRVDSYFGTTNNSSASNNYSNHLYNL